MKKVYVAAGVLIIPLLWFAASRIAGSYVVPEPWTTAYDTVLLLGNADNWRTISITLLRVCLGFAAAFAVGTVVGVASVRPVVEYLLRPLILLMQGVPPILWAIPLILIMGWTGVTPIVVIALICFPLVATTLAEGMRTVPVELREMLDVFAPGYLPRLRELILPHLKPFIAAAVRLGIGLGIKASVIAEYFAANNGIGFEVQAAYQAFAIRFLFAWALVLILVVLLADLIIRLLFKLAEIFPGPRKRLPEISAGALAVMGDRLSDYPDRKSIVLRDVSFAYPDGRKILTGLNLTVGPGETVVVSGDSGVGKTTLLKIIAGLVAPTNGYVQSLDNLGFMFQDDRLLPWRNCISNVALGLYYRDGAWAESRQYAGYILEQVGLAGMELSLPDELSGGMKKRLVFARSVACFPGALLLDEPFTGLHHEARAELWSRFSALISRRPVPVVVVTHFPEEVPRGAHTSFYELAGTPGKLIE